MAEMESILLIMRLFFAAGLFCSPPACCSFLSLRPPHGQTCKGVPLADSLELEAKLEAELASSGRCCVACAPPACGELPSSCDAVIWRASRREAEEPAGAAAAATADELGEWRDAAAAACCCRCTAFNAFVLSWRWNMEFVVNLDLGSCCCCSDDNDDF